VPIDYKKYPPDWRSEIVPRILERAENKCERCGLENRQHVFRVPLQIQGLDARYKRKIIWLCDERDAVRLVESGDVVRYWSTDVVLTIAHLDHDETNWDVKDDRLEAMCQWCHLNYDAKEKYRRSLSK